MTGPERIVLIDDDRNWVETLGDYLRGKGYEVQIAYEPDEGLALLRNNHAQLAFVDYHLPGMTGLEVVSRLRQWNPRAAVVLLSGDDEPTLARRALAAGALAFIPKSAPPADLLRAVRQVLERCTSYLRKHHLPMPRPSASTLPVPYQAWNIFQRGQARKPGQTR